MKKRRLIYRLSSLGDVVISMAALETPYDGETHWVVAREFAPILENRPGVDRVIPFDRKASGLGDWVRLNQSLFREGYTEILDLHRTFRTQIARWIYGYEKLRGHLETVTGWSRVSKERMRRLGYSLFKRFWPSSLRPRGVRAQVLDFVGAPLGIQKTKLPNGKDKSIRKKQKIGIAPASAWPGKEWPIDLFVKFLERIEHDHDLVLLGTPKDRAALELQRLAAERGIRLESWIGKYGLDEIGEQLQQLDRVVSCDSGLAHLSESVGVPVVVLYGPTRADFGFGPKDPRSVAVHTPLWCSPCSKDGTACFRPFHRYKCMSLIAPSTVETALRRQEGAER